MRLALLRAVGVQEAPRTTGLQSLLAAAHAAESNEQEFSVVLVDAQQAHQSYMCR